MPNWIKKGVLVLVVIAVVYAILWFFKYDDKLLLEYLKVILTWPVMMFFTALILAMIFNEPIAKWLSNLKIDYKDFSVYTNQSQVKSDKSNPPQHEMQAGKDNSKNIPPELGKKGTEDEFRNLAQQWRTSAYLWEYNYLNYYLVYNTKWFLHWLFQANTSFSIEAADSIWRSIIPDPDERKAILNALKQHYLVIDDNKSISITEKGKEYVDFMLKSGEFSGNPYKA